MQPIAVLMEEHRLIERMMALLRREAQRIEAGNEVGLSLIDQAVDFNKSQDVGFEWAEFSRAFHVKSPDKRWASDVLHQEADLVCVRR